MTNLLQFRFNTYREKKTLDLNVDGRTAIFTMSKKEYERVWTGLKWHRLVSFCRFLWTRSWTLVFH